MIARVLFLHSHLFLQTTSNKYGDGPFFASFSTPIMGYRSKQISVLQGCINTGHVKGRLRGLNSSGGRRRRSKLWEGIVQRVVILWLKRLNLPLKKARRMRSFCLRYGVGRIQIQCPQ